MQRILLALATTTALCAVVPAQAAPISDGGIRAVLDAASPVEKTQFLFEGNRYCFYLNGWHGPGWYRCGFAFRRGLGWGGAYGWHGWRSPAWERRGHRRHGDIHVQPNNRTGSNIHTPHNRPYGSTGRAHIGTSGRMHGTTGMGSPRAPSGGMKSGGGAPHMGGGAPGGGGHGGGGHSAPGKGH